MNSFKKALLTVGIFVGIASFTMSAAPAHAVNVFGPCSSGSASSSSVCKSKGDALGPLIKTVIGLLIYIAGAIAVIMIIIGGIRYITSNGDSSGVTGAKNTILYAVVGLVVTILAYTIVKFVLGWF